MDWERWAILFPSKDFTPVCTTELGYMAGLKSEFEKRNCKVIGLSIDPVTDHKKWSKDIEETQGHAVTIRLSVTLICKSRSSTT
jgi:alkyl hydroperoxide reductase subunit AhpC